MRASGSPEPCWEVDLKQKNTRKKKSTVLNRGEGKNKLSKSKGQHWGDNRQLRALAALSEDQGSIPG